MFENSMVMLAAGCSSELFTYGCASGRVVLKVVCSSRRKEQTHLRNEFQLLKGLEH
jgi:serine/threonine protein kinase